MQSRICNRQVVSSLCAMVYNEPKVIMNRFGHRKGLNLKKTVCMLSIGLMVFLNPEPDAGPGFPKESVLRGAGHQLHGNPELLHNPLCLQRYKH